MNFFTSFMSQKVPASDRSLMPSYYRTALKVSERILGGFFLLCCILNALLLHRFSVIPLLFAAVTLFKSTGRMRLDPRMSLVLHAAISMAWCAWYAHALGWGTGGQLIFVPVLVFVFFSVFEPPEIKLLWFCIIVIVRMILYEYSRMVPPVFELNGFTTTIYQIVTSLAMYTELCCICILFSSNTHEAEKELLMNNQKLRKEADTDPLTQLPNRRCMLEEIAEYRLHFPNSWFSVAIADIDHFKVVNDTYGHNCGDEVLRKLAELFREAAEGNYLVCRWGGEEFFFFLPQMNLDEAGVAISSLCAKASQMTIPFEDLSINITLTAGVEEYDFSSDLDSIIAKADEKLYMGKRQGRNRVII